MKKKYFFISTYCTKVLAISEKVFGDDLQLWLSLDVLNIAVTVGPEMMLPKQHPPPAVTYPVTWTTCVQTHQQMALKIVQVETKKMLK